MGFLFNQTTAPSQTHRIISITIGTIGESSASKTGAGNISYKFSPIYIDVLARVDFFGSMIKISVPRNYIFSI